MTNELNRLVGDLEFGYNWAFDFLSEVNKAVNFKAKIPKTYWRGLFEECWKDAFKEFGVWYATKGEMKEFCKELIAAIIEFLAPDDTEKDFQHYLSLFHALAILDVPKDSTLLKPEGKNKYYTFMYAVWQLENGRNSDQILDMLCKLP